MAGLKRRPGALQGAVDRDLAAFEHVRHLCRAEAEYVAQHEDRPLPWWKVLQGGDERQRHRFLCLVTCFRPGRGLRESLEQRVRVRLEAQLLSSARGVGDLELEPRG